MRARAAVTFGFVLCLLLAPGVVADAHADGASYLRPVDGALLSPFQPPDRPWGAGHRGVDLAAAPGSPVRAAADGRAEFAGTVAGARWVTLRHGDGIRTSYGPLDEVVVSVGQDIAQAAVLGTTSAGHGSGALHWSARDGTGYIDPMSLLATRFVASLIGTGYVEVTDVPEYHRYGEWSGRAWGPFGAVGMVGGSPRAREPGWQLAPNPNHVIGVAGLNSDGGVRPMDLTFLGYAVDDITYLSYAGRQDGLDGDGGRRDQLPYDREDTWRGVHEAAEKLREQLRAQWARSPGQAVDLVGHSMGGLTVAYYLMVMHDPADPSLPPIGHAVTLASPLHGSDLATGLRYASAAPGVTELIRGAGALVGDPPPPPDAQATLDLVLGSEVSDVILDVWLGAVDDPYAGPLATGTRMLTVGGSRDLVVPERRSSLPDGDHVVVPGGHDAMRRTEASHTVVHDFLRGDPYPGGPGGLGHLASYPIGWAYRGVGAAIGSPHMLPFASP